MRITAMIVFAAATNSIALAQGTEARRTITVCWDKGAGDVPAIDQGQLLTSALFREIGVIIKWSRVLRLCPTYGIVVTLRKDTPASLKPGALGSSLLYEGSYVQVFYDRIAKCLEGEPKMVPIVLAHVMAHEVAHIVEGIDRHSGQGVMKALWDTQDFFDMRRNRFGFAREDVDLIYLGLATPRGALLARNANSAALLMR